MNLKKINIENKKIRDLIPQVLTVLALISIIFILLPMLRLTWATEEYPLVLVF